MERKFTDEEVIKALKCCGNQMYSCTDKQCKAQTIGNALDLITRQKKEIEEKTNKLRKILPIVAELKAEAIREFAERLKKEIKTDYINGTREHSLSVINQIEKEMTEGEK